VTLLLIVVNVGFFIWQQTYSGSDSSSEGYDALAITERDQNSVEYGAIPYRVLNPGAECAIGAPGTGGRTEAEIVCRGTPAYERAEETTIICDNNETCPVVPLDAPAWWITIFTSMFMHIGILHFAGNMLFLWVFGNNIEDSLGRLRFLAFYLLSGLVAVYAQSLLDPAATAPTIGASGAVSGVLGAYILLHPKARVLTFILIIFFFTFIEIPAIVLLAIWFVLQALPVIDQVSAPEAVGTGDGIAYVAHVAGFLFGLATIKLWLTGRDLPDEEEPPPPRPAVAA
jgi:membrane associated rhomboid family serine protease